MRDPLRLTSVTGVGESRFRVEVVDDDVLVLDVVERLIHRIPGVDVDNLLAGRPAPSLGHLPEGSLEAVRASLRGRRVARRKVLMSGGALAAGGIVTLGLPFAAAAASRALNLSGSETELVAIIGSTINTMQLLGNAISGGSVQVLLRATNGGDGGADQTGTGGAGAYVAATIVNIPSTTDRLYFRWGQGGRGDGDGVAAKFGGDGGSAPAVSWYRPATLPYFTYLAVAGAGGGAGANRDGGDFGQPGSGAGAGGAGTSSAGGAAGTGTGFIQRGSHPGEGPEDGLPGNRFGQSNGFGGACSDPTDTSLLLGGGGGSGYYQGGGGWHGPDGGSGGGGSTYLRTTNSGGLPYVSSSRVFPYGNALAQGADLIVYYNAAP